MLSEIFRPVSLTRMEFPPAFAVPGFPPEGPFGGVGVGRLGNRDEAAGMAWESVGKSPIMPGGAPRSPNPPPPAPAKPPRPGAKPASPPAAPPGKAPEPAPSPGADIGAPSG